MNSPSRPALAAALLVLGWGALAAQQQAPSGEPLSETLDVEVTNVDVRVSDRDGHPVRGLEAADFQLFEDGEAVPISNFYAVEGGRRVTAERLSMAGGEGGSRPASGQAREAEPSSLVVYVDNAFLSPFSRNRLLDQLGPFLRRRLAGGDRVMVVSAGSTAGLEVVQPFTREWKPVSRALEELTATPATGAVKDSENRRALEQLLTFNDAMSGGRFTARCDSLLQNVAKAHAQAVFDDVRGTLQTLGGFVDSLAGLSGRKALLYVSDGLPLVAGREVFDLLEQICGKLPSTAEGLDPNGPGGAQGGGRERPGGTFGESNDDTKWGSFASGFDRQQYDAEELFHDLTRRANARRVSFFTLEARGPRAVPGSSAAASDQRLSSGGSAFLQAANFQDPLTLMADETGGRAVLDRIDFAPALEAVASDLDSYYSLGYKSPHRGDGKVHTVEVRARGKGLTVRYSRSFASRAPAATFADRTLGTLVFGGEENPLGVEAEVGKPTALDGSLFLVPVRLRIPLGRLVLLPGDGVHQGRVEMQLGARDREGRLAPVRRAEIPISIPDDQLERARGKVYVYEVKMLMREGDHEVALGVRDEVGAVASFLRLEVPVAAAAGGAP